MPAIHFIPDNKTVEVQDSESIRDAAKRAGVPIAHVCEGRGRCSTCRVVVLEGIENCSPRTDQEKEIADHLSFSSEVRLACQTTLKGDVKVRRLTLDEQDMDLTSTFIMGDHGYHVGVEKHVLIMFVDIRKFTPFAEALLPYDVIHILHRFFHDMNEIICKYGGHIDNYLGDGFMSLFETEEPEEGVLSALKAGLAMLDMIENNTKPYVEKLFDKSFDIGIGLHYGLVVAGTIGGKENKKTTVIGDAVNFASRIESANKQIGSKFLISKDTYDKLADSIKINRKTHIKLPGKSGVHTLYEVVGLK